MTASAVEAGLRCPPAVICEPPGRAGSYGQDVAEVAANLGRDLVPEQLLALDVLMAHDRRGRFLSVVAGVEGPRQTVGKSGAIMLPIALWTALTDPDAITWTAHLAETSQKQFAELAGKDPKDDAALVRTCPWLARRIRAVSYENGAEALHFRNGASLSFKVRSPGRGRGMSGNTVIDDEFLYATAEQVGAQAPTLATRSLHGNARAYRASSAAGAKGEQQRRLRARALAGDPTVSYVGWWARGGWDDPPCTAGRRCSHAIGTPGCALDDEDLLRTCNPLVDRLVSIEFLRSMRSEMTPLEFGREFLGWQEAAPVEASAPPITVEAWRSRIDPGSRARDPVVFAVEVGMSREWSSIAVAGARKGGGTHVGLIDRRAGTDWVVDRVVQLVRKHQVARLRWPLTGKGRKPVVGVVIDPTSPAGSLVPDLREAGIRPVLMTAQDVSTATGWLQDAVRDRTVWHTGSSDVDDALEGASRRNLGDGGWAFGRRASGVEIDPVVAVTNAHWLHLSIPAPLSGSDYSSTFG